MWSGACRFILFGQLPSGDQSGCVIPEGACKRVATVGKMLSHWIVKAIIKVYSAVGQEPPAELRAHSTWANFSLWASAAGL